MPKSSYYYQLKLIKAPTKYAALRARILELFAETCFDGMIPAFKSELKTKDKGRGSTSCSVSA